MPSYTHFAMPSVQPGHIDHSALGAPDHRPAQTDPGHRHVRVAVGGRVIERDLTDPQPPAGAVNRVVTQ